MPTLPDLRVRLTANDICRSGAFGGDGAAASSMLERSAAMLERIDAEHWFTPALNYRLYPVTSCGPGFLEITGGARIHSRLPVHRLKRASQIAIGVCTLGDRITTETRRRFASQRPAEALLIDTLGTIALFRVGELFEELMQTKALAMGLQASGPLSPGDDGFELGEQHAIAELAGAADIGVSITGGAMLTPEKSLTTIVGLGRRLPRWTRADNCGRCRARSRCPYRQAEAAGASA